MYKEIQTVVSILVQEKKRSIITCLYNTPWVVSNESTLFIDGKGQNKYDPTCNDDRVSVHNVYLLAMCHANVDCHLVVSQHVFFKYIAKYGSKA